ncbi:right-handed parallel beta-helix repeat-containing protein [Nocardioides sp. LS1]|uniref:right-handed parallel beta-helix repeat-containing protein n=1 Tax=Nocardioides sp. LS1 TaxID=1027620 RepID=UPI000FFA88ED|nr:right-handed parallel beta-helix repeat-containing protein [Nocardioides sp. LS1]GCD88346.1 hypothetical protein NLS1_03520 [Nocardioides sp. LS1]
MPRPARLARLAPALLVLLLALLSGGLGAPASAHEERPAEFPDGTGHRPTFLGYDNPRSRVVCKPGSADAIAAMPDGAVKQRNERLLGQCRFSSIQTAIDSIRQRRTSVYVLPGTYHEQQYAGDERSYYCSHLETSSTAPLLSSEYIGSLSSPDTGAKEGTNGESNPIALSYADQRACPHNLNLIAIFGDKTPKNDSIACDSRFCGTQVIGTGRKVTDVTVDNRFSKLNGIRADRAGGLYLKDITFEQAEFNSIYVLETDGFVLDHVLARGNDEYGILAFASDHGLIENSEAYYNGDSGFYPGSGSDLNADNPDFKATRYAIEIRGNSSHDNTLGYSGTAGNSIWAHDNEFFHNATGIATDSLFPGHPGLPQDHARWNHNDIHSNNMNWYTRFVDTGICDKPMPQRGYIDGTVCPVVPVPVGTGVLIAGGNFDSTDHNWIYDNWRNGTMQFWVPAALRDDYDPSHQYDTSNHNHTFANHMGIAPDGSEQPNGLDHWWDDQGTGNCWEDNQYAGGTGTNNFTVPPPSCADGGSVFVPGAFVKDAGFLSCSQYDRSDPTWQHPPQCEWFDSPSKPGSSSGAVDQDHSELVAAPLLTATGGLLLALGLRKRRTSRVA